MVKLDFRKRIAGWEMKICFTTALFGDPKTLDKPAKFERDPNYDYFLFTDIDEEHFDTSWDIVNIKDNPNISSLSSNTRKSRYPNKNHRLKTRGKD